MRRWIRILAVAIASTLAAAGGVALSAPYWDGPLLLIPGGALHGLHHQGPEPDWSFLRDVLTVELQVDSASPHSVQIAVIERDGEVFVPATLRPERKRWSTTLLDDPAAVMRVRGVLYDRVAERVNDGASFDALLERAIEKYNPSYFAADTTWFFRLRRPRP